MSKQIPPILVYQSPIELRNDDIFKVEQYISTKGKNRGATFNSEKNIFEINDNIFLKVDSKIFQLMEYHFHVPGEHKINNKIYPSELHYVFIEIESENKPSRVGHGHCGACICSADTTPSISNRLVIGRVLKSDPSRNDIDLYRLQIEIPKSYYEYDTTAVGFPYAPTRTIVGNVPLYANIDEIAQFSQSARELQNINGRIILFGHNLCSCNCVT